MSIFWASSLAYNVTRIELLTKFTIKYITSNLQRIKDISVGLLLQHQFLLCAIAIIPFLLIAWVGDWIGYHGTGKNWHWNSRDKHTQDTFWHTFSLMVKHIVFCLDFVLWQAVIFVWTMYQWVTTVVVEVFVIHNTEEELFIILWHFNKNFTLTKMIVLATLPTYCMYMCDPIHGKLYSCTVKSAVVKRNFWCCW